MTARRNSPQPSVSFQVAGAMEDVAAAELAAGVADLTRAADAAVVAERMGVLSEVVAGAGELDIAQAIHLLSASEDVEVMSAVVGVMSQADLEHGLQLARLSGEQVAGDIVDLLAMRCWRAFRVPRRAGQRDGDQRRAALDQHPGAGRGDGGDRDRSR